MQILLWLLAGLCLGRSDTISRQIEQSINRTIDTVERIVRNDPSLPRLSRHDILNILQNITSSNSEFSKIEKMTRDAYQRALMVVLPHSAKDAKNDLKELYTKSPMIQLIPDSKEADAIVEIGKTEEIVFPPNPGDPSPFVEKAEKWVAEDPVGASSSAALKVECKTVNNEPQPNHKHVYSDVQQNFSVPKNIQDIIKPKEVIEPEKFTFDLASLDQISKSAQEYMAATKWPFLRNLPDSKSSSSNTDKVAVVYSTSITPKPNVKGQDRSTSPSNYAVLQDPSSDVLRSDQWQYMGPPVMNSENVPPVEAETEKYYFLPTMPSLPGSVNTFFEIPKKLSGSTYSKTDELDRPSPVYVTPLSTPKKTVNMDKKATLQNNIPSGAGGYAIATKIETSVKPIDILESIGLKSHKTQGSKNLNDDSKINKNVLDTQFPQDLGGSRLDLPLSLSDLDSNDMKAEPTVLTAFGSEVPADNYQTMFNNRPMSIPDTNVHYDPVGLSAFDIDSPSIVKQNTFDNLPSDVRKGVDNLSPDVRLLFQRFGLQTSLKDVMHEKSKTTTTTKRPTTSSSYLDSFTSFKRLPSSSVENKEMRDFLAQFGLGSYDSRNPKAMKRTNYVTERPKPKLSSFDMRKALDNVGLLTLISRADTVTSRPKKHSPPKLHVFKPHEISSSEEQREKIHKLLDTVKMVQDGKVQDVEKVVADLVQTTKSLKSGPDPVNLDDILQIYNEEMKHEKKRQRQAIFEDKDTSTTSSTSTESTTVSEATSAETSSTESTEVTSTETPTTKKGSIFDTYNVDLPIPANDSDAKSAMQPDNFAALEESFGGTTAAPDPVLPTRPQTGLYFLVDWNTFLEVGEDGKDKVNLRFQPKVGDPSRFIPVKIP